jgi:hypothetical protein
MSPDDRLIWGIVIGVVALVLAIRLVAIYRRWQHEREVARDSAQLEALAKIPVARHTIYQNFHSPGLPARPKPVRYGEPDHQAISAGAHSVCSHTYVATVRSRYSGE